MKKFKSLNTVAILLVLAFLVKTGLDWHTYNTTLNSAPFRYWVLVNGVYFLLPAGVTAAISWMRGRKKDV